jgi:proline racemase
MLRARKEAADRKLDRMPSGTRTGRRAAVLAAAGWPTEELLASCWRGGLTDAQWADVQPVLAREAGR